MAEGRYKQPSCQLSASDMMAFLEAALHIYAYGETNLRQTACGISALHHLHSAAVIRMRCCKLVEQVLTACGWRKLCRLIFATLG